MPAGVSRLLGTVLFLGFTTAAHRVLAAVPGSALGRPASCSAELRIFLAGLIEKKAPSLKVAAVQFEVGINVSSEDLFKAVEAHVVAAKNQGAELVLFPELFVLARLQRPSQLSDAEQLAQFADNETPRLLEHFKAIALEHKVSIVGGSMPRRLETGRIVNSSPLVFPNGKSVVQDKIFLTPEELTWGWAQGTELNVIDAPWGPTSILICYDCEMPVLSNALAGQFPEVLLVPSMTGAQGFTRVRWSAQSRAIEHQAYVVHTGVVPTVSTVDDYTGRAAVLGPQNAFFPAGPLAEGPLNKESLVVYQLDLARLRKSRASGGVYPALDQQNRAIAVKQVTP